MTRQTDSRSVILSTETASGEPTVKEKTEFLISNFFSFLPLLFLEILEEQSNTYEVSIINSDIKLLLYLVIDRIKMKWILSKRESIRC